MGCLCLWDSDDVYLAFPESESQACAHHVESVERFYPFMGCQRLLGVEVGNGVGGSQCGLAAMCELMHSIHTSPQEFCNITYIKGEVIAVTALMEITWVGG